MNKRYKNAMEAASWSVVLTIRNKLDECSVKHQCILCCSCFRSLRVNLIFFVLWSWKHWVIISWGFPLTVLFDFFIYAVVFRVVPPPLPHCIFLLVCFDFLLKLLFHCVCVPFLWSLISLLPLILVFLRTVFCVPFHLLQRHWDLQWKTF